MADKIPKNSRPDEESIKRWADRQWFSPINDRRFHYHEPGFADQWLGEQPRQVFNGHARQMAEAILAGSRIRQHMSPQARSSIERSLEWLEQNLADWNANLPYRWIEIANEQRNFPDVVEISQPGEFLDTFPNMAQETEYYYDQNFQFVPIYRWVVVHAVNNRARSVSSCVNPAVAMNYAERVMGAPIRQWRYLAGKYSTERIECDGHRLDQWIIAEYRG